MSCAYFNPRYLIQSIDIHSITQSGKLILSNKAMKIALATSIIAVGILSCNIFGVLSLGALGVKIVLFSTPSFIMLTIILGIFLKFRGTKSLTKSLVEYNQLLMEVHKMGSSSPKVSDSESLDRETITTSPKVSDSESLDRETISSDPDVSDCEQQTVEKQFKVLLNKIMNAQTLEIMNEQFEAFLKNEKFKVLFMKEQFEAHLIKFMEIKKKYLALPEECKSQETKEVYQDIVKIMNEQFEAFLKNEKFKVVLNKFMEIKEKYLALPAEDEEYEFPEVEISNRYAIQHYNYILESLQLNKSLLDYNYQLFMDTISRDNFKNLVKDPKFCEKVQHTFIDGYFTEAKRAYEGDLDRRDCIYIELKKNGNVTQEESIVEKNPEKYLDLFQKVVDKFGQLQESDQAKLYQIFAQTTWPDLLIPLFLEMSKLGLALIGSHDDSLLLCLTLKYNEHSNSFNVKFVKEFQLRPSDDNIQKLLTTVFITLNTDITLNKDGTLDVTPYKVSYDDELLSSQIPYVNL
ncbi:MAG: hypothetical protein A3F40_02435 [Chlamydiae bacterium RIFCSPHIGHO2_12_FULL_27_8]|nr:MAG: hypothetical protein A3F40_02435 [Chlamydiae bacterium RIFCSPHIGHO2_12_FULL_27_8]